MPNKLAAKSVVEDDIGTWSQWDGIVRLVFNHGHGGCRGDWDPTNRRWIARRSVSRRINQRLEERFGDGNG